MRRAAVRTFEFSTEEASLAPIGGTDPNSYQYDTAKATLSPGGALALKADRTTGYPTGTVVKVRTPEVPFLPGFQWLGISVDRKTPEFDRGDKTTEVRFRLFYDGADCFWSGTAWVPVVHDSTDWNSLGEIQSHLATLAPVAPKIRIVIGLLSTDRDLSPVVTRAAVCYPIEVPSTIEVYLYDLLVASFKARVRYDVEAVAPWVPGAHGSTTGILDPHAWEEKVTLATQAPGVSAVKRVSRIANGVPEAKNLFQSYNPTTKALVLSEAVTGTSIYVSVESAPGVVVLTHPDYEEIASFPTVIVEDMTEGFRGESAEAEEFVNETTGAGLRVPAPRNVDLLLALSVNATRQADLLRIADSIDTFARTLPMLQSDSGSFEARLGIAEPFKMTPSPNVAHAHSGSIRVRLSGLVKWGSEVAIFDPTLRVFGVKTFSLSGNLSLNVGT